jgi:hypothetical protein
VVVAVVVVVVAVVVVAVVAASVSAVAEVAVAVVVVVVPMSVSRQDLRKAMHHSLSRSSLLPQRVYAYSDYCCVI